MRAVFLTLLASCLAWRRDGSFPVGMPVVTESELAAGARADYARDCAGCHGADGTGREAVRQTSARPPT